MMFFYNENFCRTNFRRPGYFQQKKSRIVRENALLFNFFKISTSFEKGQSKLSGKLIILHLEIELPSVWDLIKLKKSLFISGLTYRFGLFLKDFPGS